MEEFEKSRKDRKAEKDKVATNHRELLMKQIDEIKANKQNKQGGMAPFEYQINKKIIEEVEVGDGPAIKRPF